MLTRTPALRPADGRPDDTGITLIELVVTMTLMSIVGALALTWFIGVGSTNARTIDAGQSAAGARNAVTAWAGLLQVAHSGPPGAATDRISALTPTSITFDADLDNRPACSTTPCPTTATTPVTLALVAATVHGRPTSQLVQSIARASGTTRLVQVPAGASTDACLFTPYNAAGRWVKAGTTPTSHCTGLSPAELATTTRIDISFTVTPPTGPAQSYRTSVAVPGSTS